MSYKEGSKQIVVPPQAPVVAFEPSDKAVLQPGAKVFVVAVGGSLGFLFALGSQGIEATWVVALLLGGLIAAPIAAWFVRHIPPRILGSLVGGLIVLTNSRTLMGKDALALDSGVKWVVYGVIWATWIAAVVWSLKQHRLERAASPVSAPERDEERDDELVGSPA